MGDYSGFIETTKRLLTKFGKAITLNREAALGEYDPIDHKYTQVSSTVDGVGVLLNFKTHEISETIFATDKKLLFSGPDLLINDIYNGLRVVNIISIDPDEQGRILQTAQVRK